jgi:tetratricopeptide (TPR) repeat protein
MVSNIHRTIVKVQEGADDQRQLVSGTRTLSSTECALTAAQTQTRSEISATDRSSILYFEPSIPGELPPPAPRACFGRGELIERIIGLVENLTPIALIGAGGIGKTSIALTVLHHDRIKQRFGANRRFIRCDQFPPSCPHLLSRLSKVIGAGVENPEDLASLRPFLSSKEVLIVLDNAESILDPRGTDAREIYAVVEELSQLDNICLCITSRISTIPPDCETLDIPTLSIEAARDAFYRIYKNARRSDLVDNILGQLDFHPLSITLLATVAHHSKWDPDRLAREWEGRRTGMLQTEHNDSLAAAIELSLTSPLFQELGPDARALLGVVAFFPQGVNENNVDWLFPAIPNRTDLFDKFCILSLTYRSDGFVTMLAPLRDYLSPKDPGSSALLCTTKEHYFARMSVNIDPTGSNLGEMRWITFEDVNVEHLLDVFTTIDGNSDDVWEACANFMQHLFWHKMRLTILKPKIEGLPDNHRSKPRCLFELSRLFGSVGNWVEHKRLLVHALKLWRERGDDHQVAITLMELSEVNRQMGLHKEGIEVVGEALEIFERLGDTGRQADCLIKLALLLGSDKQFDAAEEAAFRAIALLPEKGEEHRVCRSHRALGEIYQSKGEIKKAIHHYELALGIASFDWHDDLFWVHYKLAEMFRDEGRLDDAQAHIEHAKLHTAGNARYLGYTMEGQAWIWYYQDRFEEARSEALRAAEIYDKLGAAKDVEDCRKLLQDIEEN